MMSSLQNKYTEECLIKKVILLKMQHYRLCYQLLMLKLINYTSEMLTTFNHTIMIKPLHKLNVNIGIKEE